MAGEGHFVWHELGTTDPAAGQAFYAKVVGWEMQDTQMPGMTYTLINAGPAQVGGITTLADQAKAMGAPPNWLGYVGVADVDAMAAKVKSLGGQVYFGPMDIPGVGRFAVTADPQGAVFALFKGASDQGPASGAEKHGHFRWAELASSDPAKGFEFYQALFGWKKGETHDMGPMGIYQVFEQDGAMIGGMMNRPPGVEACYWLYYVDVPDIDAATGRAKGAGAEILMGPAQVPGGEWISQGKDPQGAYFALMGHRA
jgi:predicted enzyme related to lactoylglutathione lyase